MGLKLFDIQQIKHAYPYPRPSFQILPPESRPSEKHTNFVHTPKRRRPVSLLSSISVSAVLTKEVQKKKKFDGERDREREREREIVEPKMKMRGETGTGRRETRKQREGRTMLLRTVQISQRKSCAFAGERERERE
jgi:hypothetical protein